MVVLHVLVALDVVIEEVGLVRFSAKIMYIETRARSPELACVAGSRKSWSCDAVTLYSPFVPRVFSGYCFRRTDYTRILNVF